MVQSQSFLIPHVPSSSLLCCLLPAAGGESTPKLPQLLSGAGKSNLGALGLPCHLAVAASAFQTMI